MAQAARPLPATSPQRPDLRLVPPPRRSAAPSAATIRRRRAVALSALALFAALVLVAVVALGGGDARGDVRALLERGAASPRTLCDHLSARMLAAVGGRGACLRASPAKGPASTVLDVKVRGDSASAVIRSGAGDERVSLVRQGGGWKIDDVR